MTNEQLLSEACFLKTLVDADIKRSGTLESTMVRAGLLSDILAAFEAQAARIAALEKALEPFARKHTVAEIIAGYDPPDWANATPERRIEMMAERKRDGDSAILNARALLNPTPTEER